jgi:hypothetical protein
MHSCWSAGHSLVYHLRLLVETICVCVCVCVCVGGGIHEFGDASVNMSPEVYNLTVLVSQVFT